MTRFLSGTVDPDSSDLAIGKMALDQAIHAARVPDQDGKRTVQDTIDAFDDGLGKRGNGQRPGNENYRIRKVQMLGHGFNLLE
ncbi:hypothetical protein ACFSUK_32395 [Sphingobium scionense]